MADLYRPVNLHEYQELRRWLDSLRDRKRLSEWGDAMRWYIENDLFFLVNDVLTDGKTLNTETGKPLFWHVFYLDWCRQIEWQIADGGGTDHSARGSAKSTLRTKASNIQRMVKYPNSAGCIFSYQRKAAIKHFTAIKDEIEANELLRTVCDDIFPWDPRVAAKSGEVVWAKDSGLRVKRTIVRKEHTLEYNAFFDGTPTGGRFDRLDFDDIEDERAIATSERIDKLHKTYDDTLPVLTPVAMATPVILFTNTFYSDLGLARRVYDNYKSEDPRKVRMVPAEDRSIPGDGPMGGKPVYPFSAKRLKRFYREMRGDKSTYAIQFLCDLLAGEARRLDPEWLIRYDQRPEEIGRGRNVYICIDPSRGIEDPMAIWAWGLGADGKAAWLDASMKFLDPALPEFFDEIFTMLAKWDYISSRVVEIRVENFGQSTYASMVAAEMRDRGRQIRVVSCADTRRTGQFNSGKRDREFDRLAGPAIKGEILIPTPINEGGVGLVRTDEKGHSRDLVEFFLEREWKMFPKCLSDNLLDAASLLWEPEDRMGAPLMYPVVQRKARTQRSRNTTAMSAG